VTRSSSALAVGSEHEAAAQEDSGADRTQPLRDGHPRGDFGAESDPARLGNYYRTGNAANKFVQLDDYVVRRLKGLMRKRHGKHLKVGDFETWTRDWFEGHGLHRLRGTIRYPEAA
jgi:RNA-directed DNA polymerase